MASRIMMSKLSPTMEEGRVLKWVKKEGDPVEPGEVVVEVETDKATMEVEATGSGILREIVVSEDSTVPTGTLLGVIADEDEDISSILEAQKVGAGRAASASQADSHEPAPSNGSSTTPQTAAPAGDGDRLRVSPLARRMASERGIALERVQGTGPGGRIVRRDIEAAAASGAFVRGALPDPETPFERVELSQTRKAIARNLVQSLGPIPHFFLTTEIDMGRVLALRAELNAQLDDEDSQKIGVNEILIKAAAQAILMHPDVNVSFADDHLRRFKRVDIGLAVALPDGLLTPVIRDVENKGLLQISLELGDLIPRGREKKLAPEEYQSATFTISNLGMYGIDEFTAVINPPAATTLAVGASVEKPVVVDGSIEIRSRMRVTLSCDHRAVDGAMGAEFLATFKRMLENPLGLIL